MSRWLAVNSAIALALFFLALFCSALFAILKFNHVSFHLFSWLWSLFSSVCVFSYAWFFFAVLAPAEGCWEYRNCSSWVLCLCSPLQPLGEDTLKNSSSLGCNVHNANKIFGKREVNFQSTRPLWYKGSCCGFLEACSITKLGQPFIGIVEGSSLKPEWL